MARIHCSQIQFPGSQNATAGANVLDAQVTPETDKVENGFGLGVPNPSKEMMLTKWILFNNCIFSVRSSGNNIDSHSGKLFDPF